jgi:UDP:flavonoid glycosyltransferase YjiC (YdhE family)
MARILLTTLGSLGDLHPLIAIGLELQQRGHAVRFCASETYRTKIQDLGFGFAPLRPDATPENSAMAHLVKKIMDPRKGTERLLCDLVMPHVEATYTDLARAVTGPPETDLLVSGELVYPAPIIAQKFGIRWASYTTAPASFFSAHDPPVLPPFPKFSRFLRALGPNANRAAIRLVKRATLKWSEPVRQLRARLALPPGEDPIYEGKFSPQLVLAIFSSIFASPQPDWPPNTVVTGFPFYDGASGKEALPSALAAFLDSGEQPIVFTLGSSAVMDPGRFYIESAEAARELKRRAVLLVGRNPPPSPLPKGVMAIGYVGFSKLFQRAVAVVHQGGVGTTGQALRAGCPTLVMPYNFDQPDNAARLVRLGVGRVISRSSYTSRRAAAELKALLTESSYRRTAMAIGRHVQTEHGAEVASEALERLLR